MALVSPITCTLKDGARITIRSAALDDAAAFNSFYAGIHETSPHMIRATDEMETDVAKHAERIKTHTDDPGKLFLLATPHDSHELIGDLTLRSGQFRSLAHRAEFGISVAAPWRSRGVGSALITSMLDWAAVHPVIEKVALAVFSNNPGARRLYARLGFTEEAILSKHIRLRSEYIDDVQMAIWVKPGLAPPGFRTHGVR